MQSESILARAWNAARKTQQDRGRRRPGGATRHRLSMECLEDRRVLTTFTVTTIADAGAGSLRQAILDANAMAGADDIEFNIPGAGPHTIQPASALPDITDTVNINGFTQAGAVANSNPIDQPINASLMIELDGTNAGAANGLEIAAGGAGSTIQGLVINRFAFSGILVEADGNTVRGNFLGTDVTGQIDLGNGLDGVQLLGAGMNTVGGSAAADRNLLSGNDRDGVFMFFPNASMNTVAGNFIGTDADGNTDLGNTACGVEIVGGSGNTVGGAAMGDRNVISGNDQHGVRIVTDSASGNSVLGNFIGTDLSGMADLGNVEGGVEIEDAFDNLVANNTIAFNTTGVDVIGGTAVGNVISENSTFSNTGPGIDLGSDGPTANDPADPDVGPNLLQNTPEITAMLAGGMLTVTFSVPSAPANATYPITVEFFIADAAADEGQTFLGSAVYNAVDFPGTVDVMIAAGPVQPSDMIVATATDAAGNTSEFSAPAALTAPDAFEPNNSIAEATVLGSEPFVTLRDLSIDNPADEDFFKITAHDTGKLIVNAFFEDAAGDLDLQVQDALGNVIATSASVTDDEQIIIPVVGQEMYFIRVFGFMGDTNTYELEIENFAAPVPAAVVLDPASDTGMMNNDNVTADTTPTFLIQEDLANFAAMGINLLTAAELAAGNVPGVGVSVSIVDIATGTVATSFADPLGPSGTLWTLTSGALADANYLVSAAAVVVDGQGLNAAGRTVLSVPLALTIDTVVDAPLPPMLLGSSDSGMFDDDLVTNKMQPAFTENAPAGTKVKVFANNVNTGSFQLVGEGVANSLGIWEITIEPLADGTYDIFTQYEDLAGNLSASSDATQIVIDTIAPNTPFLDLITDNGHTTTDNITSVNLPTVTVTANDTPDGNGNPFPNDIKYRLFLRPDGGLGVDELLIVDSFLDLGALSTDGFFTHTISLDLNDPMGTPLPDGVHNLKLEVEDRAGNISEDFILQIEIDTAAPVANFVDLIDSSDSGMLNDDNVTNKMEPAFTGISDVGVTVTLFAQEVDAAGMPIGGNFVVGTAVVGSDLTDGMPGDGLGVWEITSEPLDEGCYNITAFIEDWAGGAVTTEPLLIHIDTVAPNTPFLDLLTDSGRNNADNVTNDNTPEVTVTANDTPDGNGNPFPNDIKFRVYVRPDGGIGVDELLVLDSFSLLGGFTTDGFFQQTLTLTLNDPLGTPLPDGVHNLKLEVEDRAGNISDDFLLELTVDTTAPVKSFGDPTVFGDGLHPDSDTGVAGQPDLFVDRITSDTTPSFWGFAEANSNVEAFVVTDDGGTPLDPTDDTLRQIGEAVAIPFDGNFAEMDGRWELTSTVDLNDPGLGLAAEGARRIVIRAEDPAGNTATDMTLDIFIDTLGPRVVSVVYPDGRSVFDPKPTNGPSPLTNMLLVTFFDQEFADADGLNATLTGDQQVPPVTTDATGFATASVDAAAGTLDVDIFALGIELADVSTLPDLTAAQIQLGGIGEEGGVLVDLLASGSFAADGAGIRYSVTDIPLVDGTLGLSIAEQVEALTNGGTYFNLLTVQNPDGEIRGQILPNVAYPAVNPTVALDPGNYQAIGDANGHLLIDSIEFVTPTTTSTVITGDEPDAVFVIDVSGSTSDAFAGSPVGDLNGDGVADTILDAEIAGFIALNNSLISLGLGSVSEISIVAFDSTATQLDMDSVAGGFQLTTTPDADTDGNGVSDVEDMLRSLSSGSLTNFEDALQNTIDTLTALGTAPENGNVIFLSDGFPTTGGAFADEAAVVNMLANNVRAFGVGTSSSLTDLQTIDPTAVQFTTTDELLDVFSGTTSGTTTTTTSGSAVPGTTVVKINFAQPLPDDRITLTIFDRIADDAGNLLDGDARPSEPGVADQILPSGDGVPGEDFEARLTVDARPEIGTWSGGSVYIDTNGNFIFDPENPDDTNEDIVYDLGFASDDIFAGNFVESPTGVADGFDKLAAFGDISAPSTQSGFRWLIDVDNDGVPDLNVPDPANINGLPVAGLFDANDVNGDEVGLFTGTQWYFDTDHDFNVDTTLNTQQRGFPIVGDFDGDGFDDLGTYNEEFDRFEFDLAGGARGGWDGIVDQIISFGFPGVRERPVASDFDQDGVDDIGLWVPDRSGQPPAESSDWYFLISDGGSLLNRIVLDLDTNQPTIPFTPIPFGPDIFAQFGDEFALPVVGNFDPPVAEIPAAASSMTNPRNVLDVNNDLVITPLDALLVINELTNPTVTPGAAVDQLLTFYPDTTGDGVVSPLDALLVINGINGQNSVAARAGTGTSDTDTPVTPPVSSPVSAGGSEIDDANANEAAGATSATPPATAPASDPAAPLGVAFTARDESDEDDEDLDHLLDQLATDVAKAWQQNDSTAG